MRIPVLALSLIIAGCGGGSDTAKEEESEGVFDPMVETIDKANAVEQQLMDQKDQMDQAIKDAEGGAAEDDTED